MVLALARDPKGNANRYCVLSVTPCHFWKAKFSPSLVLAHLRRGALLAQTEMYLHTDSLNHSQTNP